MEGFCVSRTPVRESLACLEWERLVAIIPHAGAIVDPIEIALVKDVYMVGTVLDGLLEREATRRISDIQMVRMGARCDECEVLPGSWTLTEATM